MKVTDDGRRMRKVQKWVMVEKHYGHRLRTLEEQRGVVCD